jgi:glycosyltransferase involved in cell wall biosynthesis
MVMLERVVRARQDFDVVHFHVDYLAYPFARHFQIPHITTLHGRLDLPELSVLYQEFSEAPVVSISRAQQTPLPHANWMATVYHGLPTELYAFREEPGDYLAFLGRVSPEKRLDEAIEIATRLGVVLRVAAKVDRNDRDYYVHKIAPLLHNPWVDFIGEISDEEKSGFLGGARALLFPIDWPEPFGLVLIEAMACGTPVIAYRRGSVPEIISDGDTGFLVDNADQAVAAVQRLPELSRRRCREVFETRFSAKRMADDYLKIYAAISERSATPAAEGARGGRTPWTKSPAFKTSSPSSPPNPVPTNEPAY